MNQHKNRKGTAPGPSLNLSLWCVFYGHQPLREKVWPRMVTAVTSSGGMI